MILFSGVVSTGAVTSGAPLSSFKSFSILIIACNKLDIKGRKLFINIDKKDKLIVSQPFIEIYKYIILLASVYEYMYKVECV